MLERRACSRHPAEASVVRCRSPLAPVRGGRGGENGECNGEGMRHRPIVSCRTERSQTIDDGWCPMAPARWTTRFLGQYGCAVPAEG